MAKHRTIVWRPITLVVDYFKCCVVDGVTLSFFNTTGIRVV